MISRHVVRIALIAAVAALVLVPTALAGNGGGGNTASGGGGKGGGGGGSTTSSFSLVVLDGVDSAPNWGERVTFNVSAPGTDRPFVGLRCWQGTTWVYDGYVGFFPQYIYDPWLILDGSFWAPTAQATCTARLFYYDKRGLQKVLGTQEFVVAP